MFSIKSYIKRRKINRVNLELCERENLRMSRPLPKPIAFQFQPIFIFLTFRHLWNIKHWLLIISCYKRKVLCCIGMMASHMSFEGTFMVSGIIAQGASEMVVYKLSAHEGNAFNKKPPQTLIIYYAKFKYTCTIQWI